MSNRFIIFLSSLQCKARSTGTEWRSPCVSHSFGTQVGTRISCFPTQSTQTSAPPLRQLHWSPHFPLCKHRVWHQIFPPLKIITFPRLWACSFICRKCASMHFLLPKRSSYIFPGSTMLSPSPPSRLSHSDPLLPPQHEQHFADTTVTSQGVHTLVFSLSYELIQHLSVFRGGHRVRHTQMLRVYLLNEFSPALG